MRGVYTEIKKVSSKHEVPIETLHRYQRNFLVHSFLYYNLNETIILDEEYDKRCRVMNDIMNNYPEIAKISYYQKLCEPCGTLGSGYYIKEYPPEIITRSLQLLYQVKKPNEDFARFISRWGYQLIT